MKLTVKQFRELMTNTSKKMDFLEDKKVNTLDKDMISHKGCPVCNDTINQKQYPSESWTSTYYCHKCESLYFIIWADRMGGSYTDKVYIYKDNEIKKEEKE